MEREKYLSLFVDETKENLQALNDYLLKLEKGTGDLHLLNDIFRVAHTLKGMSSTMGFKDMAELTHEMESLLDLLRNAQLAISSEIIDVLFLCLDSLEMIAENVVLDAPKHVDTTNLMYRLKKLIKRGTGSSDNDDRSSSEERDNYSPKYSTEEKKLISESIENGYFVSEIEVLIMKDSAMKSIRVLLILQAIEAKGKIIRTTPEREELDKERFGRNFIITVVHSIPVEEIKNTILGIAEVVKVYSEDLKDSFINNKLEENLKNSSKSIDYTETEKNVIFEAIEQNYKCFELYITFTPNTAMKAVRASMVINTLQNSDCQIIKSIPSNNELMSDSLEDHFIISILTKRLEEQVKEKVLKVSEIDQVEILEILKSYFDEVQTAKETNNNLPALNNYEKLMINDANNSGKRVVFIGVHLMPGTVMKFARYILVVKRLEGLGEIIKTIPSQEEIETESFNDFFEIVFSTTYDNKDVVDIVSSVAEITDIVDLNLIVENFKETVLIPVEREITENKKDHTLKNKFKETDIETEKIPEANIKVRKENNLLSEDGINNKNQRIETENNHSIDKINNEIKENETKQKKNISKKPTIRVDIDRLDDLVNLIEELTIAKSRLTKISSILDSVELSQVVRNLSSLSGNLQSNAMSLRMVAVDQVFSRFPRMIRDVSKSLNKEINFIIEGEDTELDRTIIDEIGDPLVHLLRNSVDHGVENTQDRIKNGKTEIGTIKLIARHEGNNVLIIVEDDGNGINIQKVKSKALEKRIITVDQAENMSDDEALKIIFLPGFSTMDVTTDLSGRGVGMDAVLNKVRSIDGSINVQSEPGKGSRFTVKLPLTLAIMEVLLVECGDEIYAIPITFIEEVKELLPEEIKNINQVKVTVIRDKTIPLINLGNVLKVRRNKYRPPLDPEIYANVTPVVIVRTEEGKKTSGLIVDNILGQEDVVIKSVGRIAADKLNYVSGTANLGDGNLALILNITNIT